MKHYSSFLQVIIASTALFVFGAVSDAIAQGTPKQRPSAIGAMGASREPIKIDSDKLEVFDKENKAIFSGNVIVVQGESTMKCSRLVVFYEQNKTSEGGKSSGNTGTGQEQINKIECDGPVTIVNKAQTATGNHATFDRVANKVYLVGDVTLSEGSNVTRGGRLVYNLNTQIASIEMAQGSGRVQATIVPGSQTDDKKR